MQPFFISPENLAKQAYRYDSRYRVAALALIVAVGLQVPSGLFLIYENRVKVEEENRQEIALRKKTKLAADLLALKETESQLDQIKSWEPILRGRMPVSAVIGAVEQTIPPEIALSRIAVEAGGYHPVPISSGIFRVPESYRVTLEGALNSGNARIWQDFINQLLGRLPPGSSVISCVTCAAKESRTSMICKATLQAEANGNYFPLGVNKIDAEGDL